MYITVSDRPGGLAKLTALISTTGASIWDISHERAWLHQSVDQVCKALLLCCLCPVGGPGVQGMQDINDIIA